MYIKLSCVTNLKLPSIIVFVVIIITIIIIMYFLVLYFNFRKTLLDQFSQNYFWKKKSYSFSKKIYIFTNISQFHCIYRWNNSDDANNRSAKMNENIYFLFFRKAVIHFLSKNNSGKISLKIFKSSNFRKLEYKIKEILKNTRWWIFFFYYNLSYYESSAGDLLGRYNELEEKKKNKRQKKKLKFSG